MNWLRYALIAGICVVCYLLFLKWNDFDARQLAERQKIESTQTTLTNDGYSEQLPAAVTTDTTLPAAASAPVGDDVPTLSLIHISEPTRPY